MSRLGQWIMTLVNPTVEAVSQEVKGRPNLRQVYATVAGKTAEPGLSGESFEPGKCYFSVRLVELRLATAGQYLKDYLPMCTCVLRFDQGAEARTIPFIAGAEMIRGLVGPDAPADAAKRIEFANLLVADNIPMPGKNVTMYLSLCRFKDSSLVRGLLGLAETTATAIGGPVVGSLAGAANNFAKSLMFIFSADGVETRFGRLDGNAINKSGYRLLAGSTSSALESENLSVRDGQLVRSVNGSDVSIDDVDYLILAFEHRTSLVSDTFSLVEALPFHSHWKSAADKIIRSKGDTSAADNDMTELRSAVLLSPQITETDRWPLLQLYDLKREQLEAQFKPKNKAGIAAPLLNELDRRIKIENRNPDKRVGELLDVSRKLMSNLIAKAADFEKTEGPDTENLARAFNQIVMGQRAQLAAASPEQLAAAARSYAAAAARR